MILRQYEVRRRACVILVFLGLAAPALFGRPLSPEQNNLANRELPGAACNETGLMSAVSPYSIPERVSRILLPGEAPALTIDIRSTRPLEIAPANRLFSTTPAVNLNDASYRWDSSLWGRLDCLRHQRIRQGLFGSRSQRCSLG